MNITKQLDSWNATLNKADMKVKRVADQASGEYYYEVAKYDLDNSTISKVISKIHKSTGIDMRFSFLNISSVLYTTKNFNELENFVESMKFDLVDENFAYSQLKISDHRSNAINRGAIEEVLESAGTTKGRHDVDKVIASEIAKKTSPMAQHRFDSIKGDIKTEVPAATMIEPKTKGDYAVELDPFQQELISEFSKAEHKNKVKIVKSKSLGRGR